MDRRTLASHLALAEQHVEEGVRHIEQQRQRIAELQRDGHDTARAREFLLALERTLSIQRQRRNWLRQKLSEEAPNRQSDQS